MEPREAFGGQLVGHDELLRRNRKSGEHRPATYVSPMTGVTPEGARERLAAERAAAAERLDGLEREFTELVESARQSNVDDEHDPEGATIAFERQHGPALRTQPRDPPG